MNYELTNEFEFQQCEPDRARLKEIYLNNDKIRDYMRIFFTCGNILAERPEVGTAVYIGQNAERALYEFAGWQLRDIAELRDDCLRFLESELKNQHQLFSDLATNDTGRQIIKSAEELVAQGTTVQLTEQEFRALDKKYEFPRA